MRIPEKIKLTFKAWPIITAIVVAACFFTSQIGFLLNCDLSSQQNIQIVKAVLPRAFSNWSCFLQAAQLVLSILLILPAVEEVAFRWFLWKLPQPKRIYVQAVISAALFSAAHYIVQPFPDNAFVALFLFGIAQCWIYSKTNSLSCCILNHSLFNLTNLLLVFIVPENI